MEGVGGVMQHDLFQQVSGGANPTPTLHVVPVKKKEAAAFVTTKHYSRTMPVFWMAFALVECGFIEGVVVYGQPSPPIQKYAFLNRDFRLFELSRLVVQTKTRNAASFLISRSLSMLPKPCAVISYADTEFGHCGIVYQATNWIYTGEVKAHDRCYVVDGVRMRPLTIRDKFGITAPAKWAKENNVQTIPPMAKHRYFYFVGDKRQKKAMRTKLSYPVVSPYPKLPAARYDDGEMIKLPMSGVE